MCWILLQYPHIVDTQLNLNIIDFLTFFLPFMNVFDKVELGYSLSRQLNLIPGDKQVTGE